MSAAKTGGAGPRIPVTAPPAPVFGRGTITKINAALSRRDRVRATMGALSAIDLNEPVAVRTWVGSRVSSETHVVAAENRREVLDIILAETEQQLQDAAAELAALGYVDDEPEVPPPDQPGLPLAGSMGDTHEAAPGGAPGGDE